jgi:glycosidase
MPWTRGPNAGFCPPGVEPWLPLDPHAGDRSVDAQQREPGSMLTLYRRLLALRRAEHALALGYWQGLRATDGVLAYLRGGRFLVALNLTPDARPVSLDGIAGEVVLSARGLADGQRVSGRLELAGDDAVIVRIG